MPPNIKRVLGTKASTKSSTPQLLPDLPPLSPLRLSFLTKGSPMASSMNDDSHQSPTRAQCSSDHQTETSPSRRPHCDSPSDPFTTSPDNQPVSNATSTPPSSPTKILSSAICTFKSSHTISIPPNIQGCIMTFLLLESSRTIAAFLSCNEQHLDLSCVIDDLRDFTAASDPYYTFDTGGPIPKAMPEHYFDLPLALVFKILVRNLGVLRAQKCFADFAETGIPLVGAIADFAKAVKAMETKVFRQRDSVLVGFLDAVHRFVVCLGQEYYDQMLWEHELLWIHSTMSDLTEEEEEEGEEEKEEEKEGMKEEKEEMKEAVKEEERGEGEGEESEKKQGITASMLVQVCSDIAATKKEEDAKDEGRTFGQSEAFDGGFDAKVHLEDRSKDAAKEPMDVMKKLLKTW